MAASTRIVKVRRELLYNLVVFFVRVLVAVEAMGKMGVDWELYSSSSPHSHYSLCLLSRKSAGLRRSQV